MMGYATAGLPAPGDEALRRAYLLLRDPLASPARTVASFLLLAWASWISGEKGMPYLRWGLAAMAVLLFPWLLHLRRRALAVARGPRVPLEEGLRRSLREWEIARPLSLGAVALLVALSGVLLLPWMTGEESPTVLDLGVPVNGLIVSFIIAWGHLVLLPRARALVGPAA